MFFLLCLTCLPNACLAGLGDCGSSSGTRSANVVCQSSKDRPALARTHSEQRFQSVSGNAFVVLYAVDEHGAVQRTSVDFRESRSTF